MKKNPVETILGFGVLIFALVFLFFASSRVDTKQVDGYTVSANFLKIGGLEVGSDVRISGIKVGTVLATHLNKENYTADVYLNIDSSIKLPIDTIASICPNTSLEWHGMVCSETKVYEFPGYKDNGDQAYYRLDLTVRELVEIEKHFSLCDEDVVTFNGKT